MSRLIKLFFGLLAIALGLAIFATVAYGLVVPNDRIRFRLADTPTLLLPLGLIWVGWWLARGEDEEVESDGEELVCVLKLSDADFGTQPERQNLLALKHRLEGKLADAELGEIDGEEFGGGECSLFILTESPKEARKLVRDFFAAEAPRLAVSFMKAKG